jgi:hypothetical protein
MLLTACGTPDPGPTITTEQRPAQAGPTTEVRREDELMRPDGLEPLTQSAHISVDVEGFSELSPELQQAALVIFNNTAGPCAPCMEQGISLGDCLVQAPAGCENVPTVARRVVALSALDRPAEAQRYQELTDPWFNLDPGDLPSQGDGPIVVRVVVDYADPFTGNAHAVSEALRAAHSDVQIQVQVWSNPERPEGKMAALGAFAAHQQGQFWTLHGLMLQEPTVPTRQRVLELAEQGGLDMAAFRAALVDGPARDQLAWSDAQAQATGVRGAPTWFVQGVRLRGSREASEFQTLIEAARFDLSLL